MTPTSTSTVRAGIEGKIALVTGAASGIGAAIAAELMRLGARVVGVDRAPAPLEDAFVCDLTDDVAFARTVEACKALGPVAIVVHCAAIGPRGAILDAPLEDYRRIFELNLLGAVRLSQAFGPEMIERRSGVFLFISSINAEYATPGLGAYAASKAALDSICKTLALELAPHGVRANTIRPASIDTPLLRQGFAGLDDPAGAISANVARHPLGRWGRPDDVAKLAAFLVSDDASWITGAHYALDGGASITRR